MRFISASYTHEGSTGRRAHESTATGASISTAIGPLATFTDVESNLQTDTWFDATVMNVESILAAHLSMRDSARHNVAKETA